MTPLFALPGGGEPDLGRPPRRRPAHPPGRGRRGTVRLPAAPAGRDAPTPASRAGRDAPVPGNRPDRGRASRAGRSGPGAAGDAGRDHADLLAVTAPRLRRALARSFLRYGVPGDQQRAVHAAMNVVEPVLRARDTEILRLRDLIAGRNRGRAA